MSSINRIDAKQLKYNKTQLTELNAHILELLLDIDNEISDSHDSGKFFINHKLLSVFNVNVFGLALFTKEITPIMKKQKSGTIINIGSTASLKGYKNGRILDRK